jgi:hypothetical protein
VEVGKVRGPAGRDAIHRWNRAGFRAGEWTLHGASTDDAGYRNLGVYLGVLLVWQPRTYTEYVRIYQLLRRAQGGYNDGDFLRRHRRSAVVAAFFGGLLALFVGSSFLLLGISKL